ncbi:unnamed protein product [Arabidopsis halleri]
MNYLYSSVTFSSYKKAYSESRLSMPVPQKRARFKGTHLVAASLRSKAVPLVRHAFTQYDRLRSDSLGLGITLMRVVIALIPFLCSGHSIA